MQHDRWKLSPSESFNGATIHYTQLVSLHFDAKA